MTGKFIPLKADVASSLYEQTDIVVLSISRSEVNRKDRCGEDVSPLLALSSGKWYRLLLSVQPACLQPTLGPQG